VARDVGASIARRRGMLITRTVLVVSLVGLVAGCGDKASGGAPSASAAPAKSKAGDVVVITGDTKDAIGFDSGFVDRNQSQTGIYLFGNCPAMTCDDFFDFAAFKAKCPTGKKIEIWLSDAKEGTPIPTGAIGKPHVWVRYQANPDTQDDIFFDKGIEVTKVDEKSVTGKFSILLDKPEPGATSNMGQKGGSIKGDFEAQICPKKAE
jgi:hypothetical protein